MSHVVKLELEIKSLSALMKAATKCGLQFNEGVSRFNYYSNNTHACDHTISSKGASKAVGVVKKGDGYELLWDPYYLDGDTQKKLGGSGAEILRREYAVAVATEQAEAENLFVTRYDNQDGTIRLECEAM